METGGGMGSKVGAPWAGIEPRPPAFVKADAIVPPQGEKYQIS